MVGLTAPGTLVEIEVAEPAGAARPRGCHNVRPPPIADFERGAGTPMANNAQAIREALEAKGLQFIAGGVVEKAMLQPSSATEAQGSGMRIGSGMASA